MSFVRRRNLVDVGIDDADRQRDDLGIDLPRTGTVQIDPQAPERLDGIIGTAAPHGAIAVPRTEAIISKLDALGARIMLADRLQRLDLGGFDDQRQAGDPSRHMDGGTPFHARQESIFIGRPIVCPRAFPDFGDFLDIPNTRFPHP